MRPLYRAGQRDTCTVRSQPVYMIKINKYVRHQCVFVFEYHSESVKVWVHPHVFQPLLQKGGGWCVCGGGGGATSMTSCLLPWKMKPFQNGIYS